MDTEKWGNALEEQPQTREEREIVETGRALFREFFNESQARREIFRGFRAIRKLEDNEIRNLTAPRLNVLNSTIDTIIADQMDNPLEAVMIPERSDLEESAAMITDVVRFCLDQCAWDEQYARLMEDVCVLGTGFAEVFWDDEADGGAGLAAAQYVKAENVFPDPAYANIQDGRAVFKATWTTADWVREHFPACRNYILEDEYAAQGDGFKFQKEASDTEPVMLLDFWYRKYDPEKRRYEVQMAKLCGSVLLYWSENDADKQDGVYGHGLYPFAVFTYRRDPESVFGRGLMDDYAEQWRTICRYSKYIDDNARATSRARYFVRRGVVEDEIADMSRDFIAVDNPDETHLRKIETPAMNGIVFTFMQFLIESMKQDSGQNQFTRGEGGMGVTAASAIQALQEAGGKTARMHTASYKETFRTLIVQMIWILADYIDARRVLMVTGIDEFGDPARATHEVALLPVPQAERENGRIPKPRYNVRVQVQKKNPMQIQANNQYVLQIAEVCAQAGKPLPPAAILRLLQGIDNKAAILRAVEENDQTQAQMEQMAAQIEQMTGQLEEAQKQGELQKRVIAQQHQALAAQRAPVQTNTPAYGMLETTNGVNRAEL